MSDFRSLFGRKAGGATAAGSKPAPSPTADFKARFTRDLDQMDQFPSLPAVVTRLMSMLKDPMVSTQDLGHALR